MLSPRTLASAAALLAATFLSARAANLTLATSYEGSSFFDGWKYNASAIDDTTQGNVHYLSQTAAEAAKLTYVNSAGNAIIKVDNTTDGANDSTFGRNTVKLLSTATISLGSLVVMEAVHLPYGCSVWGAFWTLDSEKNLDSGGEIDIFEGINDVTTNQYALHARSGCKQANSSSMPYTGNVISTDCNYEVNANQGCAFSDPRTTSYGAGFANAGGGAFAMLWDGEGIQQWFFPRDLIPSDLESSPDPSTWGDPVASWPTKGCNPDKYFNDHQLVIDITLCGSWAGEAAVFSKTCSGTCTDLVKIPSNYDNAYFEIKSIKTYTGATTDVSAALPAVRVGRGSVWAVVAGLAGVLGMW